MSPRAPGLAALALCGGLLAGCSKASPARTPVPTAPVPRATATPPVRLSGIDETALDRSVAPCDDFYAFACGGWLKATSIPGDEPSWFRSFSVIREKNLASLRDILERDAARARPSEPFSKQLGELWQTCMDESAIEKRGLDDLALDLEAIDDVRDAPSLLRALARLHKVGVGALFVFDSEVDFKDASHVIAGLVQGGLGLPERDYYLNDDAKVRKVRAEYLVHVARSLQLLGEPPPAAERHARAVLAIETELAKASLTNVALRDPKNVYHRFDRDGLSKVAPGVPWDAYLEQLGFASIQAVNVAAPEFVRRVDRLVVETKPDDWKAYLRWHLAADTSPWLARRFIDEWFHFTQVLTGVKDLQPRWKRCVTLADQLMGEALARPFVTRYLGEEGKAAAQRMVAGIEASMQSDLESLDWMDPNTRASALRKLAKILNKIGYPQKWRDYAGLSTSSTSLLQNIERAREFELTRQLSKVGKPVDKNEWEMTPPTVNAYYDPTTNEMVFPAGILQAPFYDRTQSPALNFGAIGMVVGHELTHGFDDEGRQFDAEGNLHDWWAAPVAKEFDRRAECLVGQFDGYTALDDTHVNGSLTLGENIADLGGLGLAFVTFERDLTAKEAAAGGGLSPEKQFFLGFAQAWCASYRPEAMHLLLATNPHSPPRFRVNGTVANLPQFAAAFGCRSGTPMARPPAQQCRVW